MLRRENEGRGSQEAEEEAAGLQEGGSETSLVSLSRLFPFLYWGELRAFHRAGSPALFDFSFESESC